LSDVAEGLEGAQIAAESDAEREQHKKGITKRPNGKWVSITYNLK
jgi:hypothetical protein